MRVNSSIEQ